MKDDDARINDQFSEVKRLADEFRVKAHLASMEAKTSWDEELKPRLRKLEADFDKAVEKSNFGDEVRKLEKRLRELLEGTAD